MAEQDIVYTGGGSMRNLLAIWRAHGLDEILIDAWRRGTVLAGLSAGAMCWFAGGVSRSSGAPEVISGLGVLPGSLTVHADGEPDRLPVWLAAVRDGRLPGGWAADDGVGLLFAGARSSASSARARARPRCASTRSTASSCAHGSRRSCSAASRAPSPAPDDDVRELRRLHRFRQDIGGR